MGLHLQTRSYAWVFALLGIVSILFGVTALVWPGLTLAVLVFLFGTYTVSAGILAVVYTIDAASHHETWWPALLMAVVDLAAAGFIFTQPGLTAISLVYLVALWAILAGLFEIFAALTLGRFLSLLGGVLALAAGFVMLGNPGQGALALVLVIGSFSIVRGIIFLVEAFRRPEIAELRIG
jgi:uncharacterized membrane protein HdeD (DUF308 family)